MSGGVGQRARWIDYSLFRSELKTNCFDTGTLITRKLTRQSVGTHFQNRDSSDATDASSTTPRRRDAATSDFGRRTSGVRRRHPWCSIALQSIATTSRRSGARSAPWLTTVRRCANARTGTRGTRVSAQNSREMRRKDRGVRRPRRRRSLSCRESACVVARW